jgi:hypothetical protein
MVVLPDRTVVTPTVRDKWQRRGRSTVFYRGEASISRRDHLCATSGILADRTGEILGKP